MGETMYMNMCYTHTSTAGATAGSGVYLYPIPAGYSPNTNHLVFPGTTEGNGTIIGTCAFLLPGTHNEMGTAYITTQGVFPNWTYYVMLVGQAGGVAYGVQSSSYYQYNSIGASGRLCYSFDVSFPIA
jgi:hypothetical protein